MPKHWRSVPVILLASLCLGAGPAVNRGIGFSLSPPIDPDKLKLMPHFLLQDTVRRPEPFESTPLQVNPPSFRWPAEKQAQEYELQLSRSPQFRDAQTVKISAQFYRPLQPLAAGRWHWRVRPSGGKWPPAQWFEIGEQLPKWPIPDWSEMIARVPRSHPRIYLRPEEVAAWRAQAKGPLAELVNKWAADARKFIGVDLLLGEDPAQLVRKSDTGPVDTSDKKDREFKEFMLHKWAAISGAHKLMNPVSDLARLWLLTGDEQFAEEAKRRTLAAARLDPETVFSARSSDFANGAIVEGAAVAYDILYDRFSPQERSAIRKMLVARLQPIVTKLRNTPQRLFDAHAWQEINIQAVSGALAIYGEEPIAREWLQTGLQMFVAFYPWFGGNDGGSAEGGSEYISDMISSLDTRDLFFSAFGIDFAKENPWYRNNAYYLIYAAPPGGITSQFSDVGMFYLDATPDERHALSASRMSSLYGNPYAADYARRVVVVPKAEFFERFRWSSSTPPPPAPIEQLPASRAFYDIGMVFMHSALGRPADDVRLEFRSSPYGAAGHAHNDQNAFDIIAFNERLILDSGYDDGSGDRHHANWTRETKAHNTILVDGTGQSRDVPSGGLRYGLLRHFEQNEKWAYVIGDAAAAYPDAKLERFDRHLVWLRGEDVQTYVIIDDIAAADGRPHQFDWLLHAVRQFNIDAPSGRVHVTGAKGQAEVTIVEPRAVEITQTDKFDPPPEKWRPGKQFDLPNQWHMTVRAAAAEKMRYVVVVQVAKPGVQFPAVERMDAGVKVGNWKTQLEGRRVSIQPVL